MGLNFVESDCFWSNFCYPTFCSQNYKNNFFRDTFEFQGFSLGVLAFFFRRRTLRRRNFLCQCFCPLNFCRMFFLATDFLLTEILRMVFTARIFNDNFSVVWLFATSFPAIVNLSNLFSTSELLLPDVWMLYPWAVYLLSCHKFSMLNFLLWISLPEDFIYHIFDQWTHMIFTAIANCRYTDMKVSLQWVLFKS